MPRGDGRSAPAGSAWGVVLALVALLGGACDGDAAAGPCDPADPTCLAGCGGTTDWPADWAALEAEVVAELNARRAAGGRCVTDGVPFEHPPAPPLVADPAAGTAARCHSLDMARSATLRHEGSDGSAFWQRLEDAGYTGQAAAENVAVGYPSAAAVVDGWMGSTEGHCNAVLDRDSNEVGVGYVFREGAGAGHWWTADFGRRP